MFVYNRYIGRVKLSKKWILDDLNKLYYWKEQLKKHCGNFVVDCIRVEGPYTDDSPMYDFLEVNYDLIAFSEECLNNELENLKWSIAHYLYVLEWPV